MQFPYLLCRHHVSHFPTIPPDPPARSMALFHNPNPSKFVVCTKTHYFPTIFLGFAVFFLKVPEGSKAPLDVHQVPLEPLFLPTLQCHPNRLFIYLFVQSPQTHLLGRILDSLSTLDKLRYPMPFAHLISLSLASAYPYPSFPHASHFSNPFPAFTLHY